MFAGPRGFKKLKKLRQLQALAVFLQMQPRLSQFPESWKVEKVEKVATALHFEQLGLQKVGKVATVTDSGSSLQQKLKD